uniref:Uncharacterized protein n=1 Tax=Panagrolaimus superbus TaxID=310955 RepID=A0A914YF74_9BILA
MVFLFNAFFLSLYFGSVAVQAGAIDFSKLFNKTDKAGGIDFTKFLNKSDSDSQEFSNLIGKLKFKFSDSTEVSKRLGNFRNAKNRLRDFQSRQKNAKFAVNKFSLMSKEEQQQFLGARPSSQPIRNKRSALNNIIDQTSPTSFDWRDHGKVTPVKNQQQCGSCWAFTTAGAIESQYLLRYNLTLDLSEQDLVSCTATNGKCNGGDVIQTINSVKANGITTEACNPYTATNGTCSAGCNSQKYFVGGYNYFGNDETKFATLLYNYGPATMVFDVPPAFMSYSSGVLEMPAAECKTVAIGGHGMIIVGYTPDYWIVKNSWGPDWGENGYVRIKRGQNFCSMTTQVAAPFLNSTTPTPVTPATTPPTTTAPMSGCSAGNGVSTWNNAARYYALQLFNGKRSEIAKGTFVMSNGATAPASKNMNKLVYSCEYETAAQQYATTCNSSYLLGNTMAYSIAFPWVVASINESLTTGVPYFYGFTVVNSNGNATITQGTGAFGYDNAKSIGCGFTTTPCTSAKTTLVCVIGPLQPASTPLYSVGTKCSANAHCTRAGYPNCDVTLGLCFA